MKKETLHILFGSALGAFLGAWVGIYHIDADTTFRILIGSPLGGLIGAIMVHPVEFFRTFWRILTNKEEAMGCVSFIAEKILDVKNRCLGNLKHNGGMLTVLGKSTYISLFAPMIVNLIISFVLLLAIGSKNPINEVVEVAYYTQLFSYFVLLAVLVLVFSIFFILSITRKREKANEETGFIKLCLLAAASSILACFMAFVAVCLAFVALVCWLAIIAIWAGLVALSKRTENLNSRFVASIGAMIGAAVAINTSQITWFVVGPIASIVLMRFLHLVNITEIKLGIVSSS